MKLDTSRELLDWRKQSVKQGDGTPTILGPFLAGHLGMSSAVPKDQVVRAAVLSIKLESGGEVNLAAADVELINAVLGATPNIPPWVVGAVRYLTDGDSLSEEDRAVFAGVYGSVDLPPKGNGTGKRALAVAE